MTKKKVIKKRLDPKTSEEILDYLAEKRKKEMYNLLRNLLRNLFIIWITMVIEFMMMWYEEGHEWIPNGMTEEEYILEKYHFE